MADSRMQTRAICPICGCDQAVRNGRMVAHGYTIEYGMQSGDCFGVGRFHYGHEGAPKVINDAIEYFQNRTKIIEQDLLIAETKHKRFLKGMISQFVVNIEYLEKRLTRWVPADTYTVNVDIVKAEQRVAIDNRREEKRIAKELAATQKAERAAKTVANKAKKEAELLAENHYQLIHCGAVIKSWTNSFELVRDLEHHCYDTAREFAKTLVEEFDDNWEVSRLLMSGQVYVEVRNKADGKGRKLFSTKSN